MWYKPNELTGFEGIGYEMVFYSTYPGDVSNMAQGALNGWKNSSKHNEMIIHKGMWKQISWKTIGIGIVENYAVVWFSDTPDPRPIPLLCE